MIDLQQLCAAEQAYYEGLADVVERPFGRIYYNTGNPQYWDANHAVILNPAVFESATALEATADDIIAFYSARSLTPRLYGAYRSGARARLEPVLCPRGFRFEGEPEGLYVKQALCCIAPNPALKVRRVRALDEGLLALIHSEGEAPWQVLGLTVNVQRERYHWLVGYANDVPVTMAALVLGDEIDMVIDVLTHPAYRGHGYARELLRALVAYHAERSSGSLCLLANNPVAIRIYQEAGFEHVAPVEPFDAVWEPALQR